MESMAPVLENSYLNSLSEIITVHNDLLDYGRISEISGSAIQFVPCREDLELPLLLYGTPVKVNVYNFRIGFKVLSGIVTRSDKSVLKVSALEMLVASDRRQFLRIKVNETGYVSLFEEDLLSAASTQEVRVNVEDVSLSGVQFSSPALFGLRSKILVRLKVFEFPLELICDIQRIVKGSGHDYSYYYGCQYLRLSQAQEETLHKVLLRLQQSRRIRHNL